MNKKKILVISAGRSDFYRFLPIVKELHLSSKAKVFVYLSQTYNNKIFGEIDTNIKKKFNFLKNFSKKKYFQDNAYNMINNLSIDAKILSKHILTLNPDLILIMGDRYEMLLGPIVSIPNNIPLIHFFGGAITEGAAIDELTRHALSKMSHYHFVLINKYKNRLCQLGEESWRIKTIGLPTLSKKVYSKNTKEIKFLSKKYNFNFLLPFMLVTFHPVTSELKLIDFQIKSLIKAIKISNINAVITYPNSDPKYDFILRKLKINFKDKTKYLLINNLGEKNYFSLMKKSCCVLGNSSSGIVEAASFRVPVINIGSRQNGKFKPINIIDVSYDYQNILKGIKKALSEKFKKKLKRLKNPYNSKISVNKIVKMIINLKIDDKLIKKKFIDLN